MRQPKPALLVLCLLAAAASARAADLNLLLITVDTLRPDRLSCYSPKYVRTPRIDGLAARGVLFERAFAHDPLTLPSHANILLGLTALAHGVNDNGKAVVPRQFQSLAEVLKAGGYATGAFVSAFPLDSRFGLNQGFDVYDDKYPSRAATVLDYPERRAEKTIAAALEWLAAQKGKWFCWVHLFDPHYPYAPPEPFAGRFRDDPYSGEVAYVDDALGKLFDAMDERGETGRTLIILTADHGESLGEHGELTHGYFAYNSTIWVPLIIAGPGMTASRVKDNVSHVDIFPSVCDLLGARKPPALQGDSLRPLLQGKTRKPRPVYFEAMEGYLNRGGAPLRGVIENGKKYFDSPLPELYDLRRDFDEATNLAPGTDLTSYKKRLEEKTKRDSSPPEARAFRRTDKETQERLRSLGYASASFVQPKSNYGPEDDLKTLLPFEQKLVTAAQWASDGKLVESAGLLEEVIRARKDNTRAYAQLAELHFSQGRADGYLDALARGAKGNPGNFTMVSAYGIALVENQKYDPGIDILGQALALFDQDANVRGSLGEAYWKKGDYEKALEHFNAALALAPGDAIINGNFGNFYVAWGLKTRNPEYVKRSFAYFEAAIATDPSLASVHNGLGGAWKIMGNTAGAIASWEKAVALDPSYDLPVYNLALAYLETGDKTRALDFCRKYLFIKGTAITEEERRDIESLIDRCRK